MLLCEQCHAAAGNDCLLSFTPTPTGSSATGPCSGMGLPAPATGQCNCFVGYDGPACGQCAEGFTLAGGLCQRTFNSFLVQAILAGQNAGIVLPRSQVNSSWMNGSICNN